MNKRDDFSQKTIDRLCERVGGKCSNPNCRRETKGPHSNPRMNNFVLLIRWITG